MCGQQVFDGCIEMALILGGVLQFAGGVLWGTCYSEFFDLGEI